MIDDNDAQLPDNDLDNEGTTSDSQRERYRTSGGAEKTGALSWLMRSVRTKGDKRMLIGFIGVVVVIVGYLFLSGGGKKPKSDLQLAPSVSNVQGSSVPSPAYSHMLNQQDQQRANEAAKNGTSALPTIQMADSEPQSRAVKALPKKASQKQKSSAEILPDQPVKHVKKAETQPAPPATNYVNVNNSRVDAIAQEMASLDVQPGPAKLVKFDTASNNGDGSQKGQSIPGDRAVQSAGQPPAATPVSDTAQPAQSGPFTVPAPGTHLYSVINGYDSNAPGPITGTILQGKLSGSRLIGTAQKSKAGVAFHFTSMTVPYHNVDGVLKTQTLRISAYAINASTGTSNLATSVNNHLWERLAVTFASSFLNGFGQLLTSSGASTVITPTGGIGITNPVLSTTQQLEAAGGSAAGAAGNLFNQVYGNQPTTIKTAQGTPFILLFVGSGS